MSYQTWFPCMLSIAIVGILSAFADADATRPYAHQLAQESDALLSDAIRRSYGWAWDRAAAPEPASRSGSHSTARRVSMEALATPAAGLVLLWAGRLLDEPRYVHAAEEAARGVAASQMPTGMILSHPVFGASAGGRDEQAVVNERASTCASLGLLLALINDHSTSATRSSATEASANDSANAAHFEAFRRTAARGANWLGRQQAPNGLWPSAFPPDAGPKDAIRLVRLDDNDYRDSTFALLLASDQLHDALIRTFAQRSLDGLLKLRLPNDPHGPNLWSTASTLDGSDVPPNFPNGPDVLASRYVMQTLLGGYLFTADRNDGIALDKAAATLRELQRPDGLYDRFLDPTAAADVARSLGIDTASTQAVFAPRPTSGPTTRSVLAEPSTSGSFAVSEMIQTVTHLKSIGPDRYMALLAANFTARQHLCATLCGLSDTPLTLELPLTAAEVAPYIAAHDDLWRITQGPPPDDLAGRVRRLWVLLLRAKLERLTVVK